MSVKEMYGPTSLLTPYVTQTVQSASFNSDQFNVQQFANWAIQLDIASQSSLNVAVKVQATLNGTSWADVPSTSTSFTANGTFIWTYANAGYIGIRLAFTFTAGSALFTAIGFAKTQ